MQKILIIRFSALGDVAMTVPVVYALAKQHRELDITMLSRPFCAPFFEHLPQNVHFVSADFHGRHKGFAGVNRLLRDIRLSQFDYIADFHDVLRTQWIRFIAHLCGKKVAKIDKGRRGKKQLMRAKNKVLVQQKTSFERYADVLAKLGLATTPNFEKLTLAQNSVQKNAGERWIGIAPFAKHEGKIYPIAKLKRVIELLSNDKCNQLFLFGAGSEEKNIIDEICAAHDNVHSAISPLKIAGELQTMSQLDVMLSMDSSNMHMASLVGAPVVSIWGATHPFAGFLGWNQKEENCVQLDLPCRPCSIFGNKPCAFGDYRCMNNITPEMVVERINKLLK